MVVHLTVLKQQQRTQAVFAAVTGATSLICLLVGGVGIMNILLASVSERIREIGIRRAVGATREDIAAQFLAEGALLSAGGSDFAYDLYKTAGVDMASAVPYRALDARMNRIMDQMENLLAEK